MSKNSRLEKFKLNYDTLAKLYALVVLEKCCTPSEYLNLLINREYNFYLVRGDVKDIEGK